MYLDKPLRDHKLLQAIARTNRSYPGKDAALIVDYVGILKRLEDALNFDSEDIEGIAETIEALKDDFKLTMEALRDLLKDILREDTNDSQIAAIKLFQDEEVYSKFQTLLAKAQSHFEMIAPDPDLSPYLRDYKWFNQLNEIYNKWLRRDKESLKPYMEKTRELIQDRVFLEEIDKTLPVFKIGPDYLEKIERQNYDTIVEVAELRQALAHYIRINIELNPLVEPLGERVDRIVKQKDPEKVKKELRDLIDFVNQMEQDIKDKGMTHEEHALLVVTQQMIDYPEEQLIPITKEIDLTRGLFDYVLKYRS
jgi:type I restriction enzyme R subunit